MTLEEIVNGIADALEPIRSEIPNLQIHPYWLANPTPPAIDIYPGEPFQDAEGFDVTKSVYFTVRARVVTGDPDSAQKALLRLLEPAGPTSVEDALVSDGLGGIAGSVAVTEDSPSGYRQYHDLAGRGDYLGVEWRVQIIGKAGA